MVAAKANQNPPIAMHVRLCPGIAGRLARSQITDGAKNDTRKRIAEYEFQNTGDEQQQAAEEDDRSTVLDVQIFINYAGEILLT